MEVSAISFAYPDLDRQARAAIARRLTPSDAPGGTFVLATCLRTEIAVVGDETGLDEALSAVLPDLPEAHLGLRRHGEAAARHLTRVAAGLESPIVGEQEVLTQFRQAAKSMKDRGGANGTFTRLLDSLVAIARRVRESIPGSAHGSLAAVAAQVIGAIPRVAVLGSGTMSTAVATNLLHLPAPPKVTMVARHPERVRVDGVEVWPFDRASEALACFPAAVTATSAKSRPFDEAAMASLLSARQEPLLLVDMAMPPDFEPPDASPVTYVDIDALAEIAGRRPRTDQADALVEEAVTATYEAFRSHPELAPIIAGLIGEADRLTDEMVERFGGRVTSDRDREILRQTAHTVSRALLAAPIEYLKNSNQTEATRVIAAAFGVDDA